VAPVIQKYKFDTAAGEAVVDAYTACVIGLDRFLPRTALRRIDRLSQMSLLSSFLAIEDSGLALEDRTRVGIVFGSGYGPVQSTLDFHYSLIDCDDLLASPTMFANSVHNALTSQATISLKINGPCLTVTSFEQTAHSVFSTAMGWLSGGQVDYVLCGVGDEYCALRGYVTGSLNRGDGPGTMRPLSFDECSFMPGEGFVSLLLGKEDAPGGYCRLTGATGGRFDAVAASVHEHVFIAANGARELGGLYRPLLGAGKKVSAYAPLYGGMPTGNGFDVAIAAVSLRDGAVYQADEARTAIALGAGAGIDCVGFDMYGNCSVITLEGRCPTSGPK
jgi:3-oxoacyl-[acyl-carrier-protein] synthase II